MSTPPPDIFPEVARHRTALSRNDFSRPIRLALEDGLINGAATVMDYGCGLGGDVERLSARGVDCVGWDPTHRPSGQKRRSEVVNIGYVVNVIEDIGERAEALRAAWSLAERVMVVSARLKADLGTADEPGEAFADGRLTRLQTFQKFYEQQELRLWIGATLGVVPVAAGPGVFYLFRDASARETFLAARVRRAVAVPRISAREALLAQYSSLFDALGAFLAERGRPPGADEFAEHDAVVAATGSIARACRILESASEPGAWDRVKEARQQDLLVYLALARFDGRPSFGDLAPLLQRDVKSFCGSYTAAKKAADDLLFSLGAPGRIDAAARAAEIGKLMPTALYLHESAIAELPVELRLFEGCARTYYGAIPGANIIKINRTEPKVTYLSYPDFETDPHPSLRWSVSINLQTFRVKQRAFAPDGNIPILHRKELFLSPAHPLHGKFARLTRIEEDWGLFENPAAIGLKEGWAATLKQKGLALSGHRVIRRHGET
jgi:DNA phosphorothioation-associated putative methyltransferase